MQEQIVHTTYEYKHVHFDYGLLAVFDRQTFDDRLASVLNTYGAEGWELKGCFHDYGYHGHLIFGRPVVRESDAVLAKSSVTDEP